MAYKSLVLKPVKYSDTHSEKQSQFYRGFSTVDETVTDTRLYDFALIKQDLLNQFNVRKGELVMNPAFGTIIWDVIYDPFTKDIKEQIVTDVTQIASSDPRATVEQVNITEQDYGLMLELTLVYVGTDQSDQLKLSFDKKLGVANAAV